MTAAGVFEAARRRTADVHLWMGDGDVQTWSATELRTRARACGREFKRLGLGPSDTVAICAETSLTVLACIVGAWDCGAAVAMLPPLRLADGVASGGHCWNS